MKAAGRLPYVIAGVKDLQLAVSAKYVQEIDVPLQYLKEERRLRATIAELEAKLRGSL